MKIGIISDSHDNLATLKKFTDYCIRENIKTVIHCGDVAEQGTLKTLAENLDAEILLCLGNADHDHRLAQTADKTNGIRIFRSLGTAEIGGLKIGFVHYRETALKFLGNERFDFIFYGHTHKPWMENVNGCVLANPGNLAGLLYKATFATLETATRKLNLKIVDQL
ncbi:MAG TPA: YfcE family phosphodiesterase [Candidatus Paceibacterota bacterium]|nr:YfcE family phosphodiesterase [Candidatus Pacearchaeota archaeon]HRZ50815.1 YfcE family phosphodiesterase [Candidatus Paceibacterota bacterium]HSA36536.1 YfcE family phosphodiesterase [Candidatus Paceibacterota bacterium]